MRLILTHRDHEDRVRLEMTLRALGLSQPDIEALRRISRTLRTWSEREGNGEIERAGEQADGHPYRSFAATGGTHLAYRIPDRERGAERRLAAIMTRYPSLTAYVQGDPRGCALYLLRPGDVPEGQSADGYYTRGIAIY